MARRKADALAVVDPAPGPLTAVVPSHAGQIATLQAEAEGDLAELAEADFRVDSDEAYTTADALLTSVVRRKDAVKAMLREATKPLADAEAAVRAWFAPVLEVLATLETALKGQMGDYTIAKAELARAERARALEAAKTGDVDTLNEALTTVAESAEVKDLGRATQRLIWVPGAIDPNELPAAYFQPNRTLIEQVGKAHKGDDPPPIPGVVWERKAITGGRR